ncbi:GDSL-type esterase/lipase family protein [Microterricola viridarii]|uniref:Lysophospholipase L1 n=1 Tax=Microterricola viridarii TaxID=412690 RepID=A0A1H1SG24_9MICO|nr:GDSL-type esterase/lipase family protein [Microterricola viridarii]SDS46758.1 Lysophospholipase L1 [Microterricola viridarii]
MPGTIAFVGDSLTAAGRWDEWLPEFTVSNHAAGGATTADVLAEVDVVLANRPDAYVLLIGTNDLAWRKSVEHVVRNVESILATVHKHEPSTRMLVQSVLPREPEFAASIRDINRHLWQYSSTVRAQFLDLWPVLADENGALSPVHSEDGLHLTAAGYELWLDALRPAIERLFAVPTTTTPIDVLSDAISVSGLR